MVSLINAKRKAGLGRIYLRSVLEILSLKGIWNIPSFLIFLVNIYSFFEYCSFCKQSFPVVLLLSSFQQSLSVFPSMLSQSSYIFILVLFLCHFKIICNFIQHKVIVDIYVILDNTFCDYKLINLAFTIRIFYSSIFRRYTWSSSYISFQQNFMICSRGCSPFDCFQKVPCALKFIGSP